MEPSAKSSSQLDAAVAAFGPLVPFERTFDALYGPQIESLASDDLRARVAVTEQLLGIAGTVHSGVFAAIAEGLASMATALETIGDSAVVAGMSNSTVVLSDVRRGTLQVLGRCRAKTAGEWFWEIDAIDDNGVACATSTVVIAVRPSARA